MMKTKAGRALLLLGLTVLAYIASAIVSPMHGIQVGIACICVMMLFLVFCLLVKLSTLGGEEKLSLTAVVFVFVIGLIFILVMPYNNSTHDLCIYEIGEDNVYHGHLGYIRWIAERGIPLLNPFTNGNSILYHPPFAHILYAGIIRFGTLLGLAENVVLESMQVLGLLYAVGFAMAGGLICKELGAKDSTCALATLFSGMTPIVLLTCTVPNNDMITAWLMTLCVLFTIRWIKSFKISDIIGIALSLGFAMASKMNAAIAVPAVAVVFLIVLIQKIKQKQTGKIIKQYGIFLLCCVPEAMVWPLYHLICFNMPINYVRLSVEEQYVGHWPLRYRFGFPNTLCLKSLFFETDRLTNHNVWWQTLKTATFDEKDLAILGGKFWCLCYALIIVFTVICIVLTISGIINWLRNLKGLKQGINENHLIHFCLGISAVSTLISYIAFCCSYPYLCSFNFRYIMNILPLLGIGLCLLEKKRVGRILSSIAVIGFSGMVCLVYIRWFMYML